MAPPKPRSKSTRDPSSAPEEPRHTANVASIASLFAFWKILLLVVVAASPGPGYDTSTDLLLADHRDPFASIPAASTGPISALQRLFSHLLIRLVRWDAVYFVNIAHRGYLFEQEWAFGRGFTTFNSIVAQGLSPIVFPNDFPQSSLLRQALAGVVISHIAHLLSCLFLYALTLRLLPADSRNRSAIATLAACLHVLSPAGVFLITFYAEAPFSCLNILGFLLLSFTTETPRSLKDVIFHNLLAVWGGVCFAVASTWRGNGLLSVLAFGVYALPIALRTLTRTVSASELCTLPGLILGAVLPLAGYVIPQYIAFREYCLGESFELRPWCTNVPPGIFSFVQAHYWNVGFLKYWTLSNLPLFLIALPLLALLSATAVANIWPYVQALGTHSAGSRPSLVSSAATAAPQLALAVLALTSFHVQIINRIASGYPTWYVILAVTVVGQKGAKQDSSQVLSFLQSRRVQRRVVKGMMIYAVVQAGLYASFLPPA
ncbi:glycosyltransferase family 76 protein [Myriangium duriaei CBS 260.36]|uniref:GPI mannosyltransferase 2 n=1 Tax=Myriangium duriaei CBS 260.36 TaxID=1168546 RepID=A0A9P4IW98_9PEZI|nr:glycosyltransferase family 76 protein [Myriangium duriaei CBS 260.36]